MSSRRDRFLDAAGIGGVALVAVTEALSALGMVTRPAILAIWIATAALLARRAYRVRRTGRKSPATDPLSLTDRRYAAAFIAIAGITLYLALVAAPNAWDAQSYHLPRVLRWIQERSLAFYPSYVLRQLWIGPGHEYLLLHLQLVTGTVRVANLVQWAAFIGCGVAASVLGRELGAGRPGQLFAALFALTLPMAIVQASGSQVDLVAAFWLACAVALMLRVRRQGIDGSGFRDAVVLGGAAGLAVLSKASNALFLLPFVLWMVLALAPRRPVRFLLLAAASIVIATGANAAHMYRNHSLFRTPLGPPAAAGVRSEIITPASVASGVLRNLSLHAATHSARVNNLIYLGVAKAHRIIGLDVNDPRTSFSMLRPFRVPLRHEDEGTAGNPVHLVLIGTVLTLLLVARERSASTWYLFCVLAGALLFVAYLKWQPWHSRLHLPLFVVSAGAVGAVLERKLSRRRLGFFAAALVLLAVPPLLRNSLRPIVARRPVFTVPYERMLFTDSGGAYDDYAGAADFIAGRGCTKVGLIADESVWEYPLWYMLARRLEGKLELRHVHVWNVSRSAASDRDRAFTPCAIVSAYYFRPPVLPFRPEGYVEAFRRGQMTVYLPATT